MNYYKNNKLNDKSKLIYNKLFQTTFQQSWSQWPRSLRRGSMAVRSLRLWVRIPPGAWMSVVRQMTLRPADHSSIGVLPTVGTSLWVTQKPHELGGLSPRWTAGPKEKEQFDKNTLEDTTLTLMLSCLPVPSSGSVTKHKTRNYRLGSYVNCYAVCVYIK